MEEKIENNTIEQESIDVQEPKEELKQEELVSVESDKKVIDKKSIKISKKTIIIIAIVLVVGILVYFSKSLFVAATVDGSPISRMSLISKLEKTSGKSLLDSLITEKLIENEVKSRKIVVSSSDVDVEIKKIEEQITAQGSTIEAALSEQAMTINDLKKQIKLQKEAEKLVADKIGVTDEEVAKYIVDNKIEIPKGQEVVMNEQIKAQLSSQALGTAIQGLITELKAKAKINYFVKY